MASAVGKFFGEFGLDIDPFLKSIRTIESESKSIKNTLKPMTQAAEELGKSFSAAGLAITGTLGLMVKQAADYGDAIRDASIRTGVTTQAMGGLKIAAEQSGASFEDLQNGLKKLAVNSDKAAAGSKEQVQLFKSMGVNVRDTTGAMRPMSDILGDVAEHFKNSTNKTQEAGEAVALFGKNGTQLLEFLELGKVGLQAFQDKAEHLGLAIGGDVANQADAFKDTLNDLHDAELGASIVIGNIFLPALTSMAVSVTNTIVKVREFIDAHHDLVIAVGIVGGALTGGGGLLLGLAGLLTIIPQVVKAWNILTLTMDGNPILFTVGAITALTVALIAFRKEIAGGFAIELSYMLKLFEKMASGMAAVAGVVGADGLAAQFGLVAFGIKEGEKELQDWARSNVIVEGDAKALAAQILALQLSVKKSRGEIQENTAALDAASAAARRHEDAVASLTKSVIPNAEEQSVLTEAIIRLYKAGLNVTDMLPKLGKAAREMAQQLNAAGLDVSGPVQALANAELAKEASASLQKILDAYEAHNDGLIDVTDSAMNELVFTNIDAAARSEKAWEDANDKALGSDMKLFDLSNGLRRTDLDDRADYEMKKEAQDKANAARAERFWSDAMAHLSTQVAGSIADMIVHAKFNLDSLVKIAQETAAGMLKAFLTGLISPLTNALANLGKSLSNWVMGRGGSGGVGGILNSVTGIGGSAGIGSLTGIGSGAGAYGGSMAELSASVDASGVITSGTVAGSTSAGLSNAIMASAVYAAPIAIALMGAKEFIGRGRKVADAFVQSYQDPFDQARGQLFNAFDAGIKSDTLTPDAAQAAIDQMKSMLAAFDTTASHFADVTDPFHDSSFSQREKVAAQARATEDPFMAALIASMEQSAAGIQTRAAGGDSGATATSMAGTGGGDTFNLYQTIEINGGGQDLNRPTIYATMDAANAKLIEDIKTNRGGIRTALKMELQHA